MPLNNEESRGGEPEEWRPVVGWEGLYEVSSLGQVRSLPRPGNKGPNQGQILKGAIKNGRHRSVTLRDSRNSRRTQRYIHQIVAEAFIPNPGRLPYVCHRDDNAEDNSVQNLKWGTPSDNMFDRVKNGGHPAANITHCIRGHEYSPENTGINSVHKTRYCKTCKAAQERTRRGLKR